MTDDEHTKCCTNEHSSGGRNARIGDPRVPCNCVVFIAVTAALTVVPLFPTLGVVLNREFNHDYLDLAVETLNLTFRVWLTNFRASCEGYLQLLGSLTRPVNGFLLRFLWLRAVRMILFRRVASGSCVRFFFSAMLIPFLGVAWWWGWGLEGLLASSSVSARTLPRTRARPEEESPR